MSGIHMIVLSSGGGGPTNFGGTYWRAGISSTTATVTFTGTGGIDGSGSNSVVTDTVTSDSWHSPENASGASYWVRATLSSGTTPSTGTMGSWLQLNSARSWSNTRSTLGSKTSTILFEVSTSSGGSPVVCSGTITVQADMDN